MLAYFISSFSVLFSDDLTYTSLTTWGLWYRIFRSALTFYSLNRTPRSAPQGIQKLILKESSKSLARTRILDEVRINNRLQRLFSLRPMHLLGAMGSFSLIINFHTHQSSHVLKGLLKSVSAYTKFTMIYKSIENTFLPFGKSRNVVSKCSYRDLWCASPFRV